jgi:hypothetical protein
MVRKRYDRLARGMERVVVPAINGHLLRLLRVGPHVRGLGPGERAKLRNCDHCGRFLYFVDSTATPGRRSGAGRIVAGPGSETIIFMVCRRPLTLICT